MKNKHIMENKIDVLKRIIMYRRTSSRSRFMEESKMYFQVLSDVQEMHSQILKQLHILNTLALTRSLQRMSWKIDRPQTFWETVCQSADNDFFKNNFRMNRVSFYKLCALVAGLQKNDTNMREAIPLEKRIAISLYALGSSAGYRKIANIFGVGKSTVCKVLLNFCAEVWRVLAPIYLNNFPLKIDKIQNLVKEFDTLGFPQCMGALGCCHIEIHPLHEDATDYYNNKKWYSIVLLALVDARCRFIYVNCGSPGRCSDSEIYQQSSLQNQLDKCAILNDLRKNISDVDVPVHIIADSGFRLSEKLMKPYPFSASQSNQQKYFNCALFKSRRVVESAFEQLKARFRRIGKGIDHAIKNANSIVLACCVLHNFLNENNDEVIENWLQAFEAGKVNRSYPEFNSRLMDNNSKAHRIRNAIAKYLCEGSANVTGGDGDSTVEDVGDIVNARNVADDYNDESGNGTAGKFEFMYIPF